MRIHPSKTPKEIKNEYEYFISADGLVYLDICKGMYGLKEVGVLTYNQLVKSLAPHGYEPMPHSTGLWQHHTLKTSSPLCVDDFGVKYFSKTAANHLINALHKNYNITTDWAGSLYCGLTLQWNYEERWVDIHMPGYVIRALTKFNHPTPQKPQHASHTWIEPK